VGGNLKLLVELPPDVPRLPPPRTAFPNRFVGGLHQDEVSAGWAGRSEWRACRGNCTQAAPHRNWVEIVAIGG
jgi:hypothetical protein